MEKEIKVFTAEVKDFNEKDLTVTHFISTEKKDRGGDIMRADGMKIRGRPVVLLLHGFSNIGSEPIAKPLSIKKGEFKGNKGIMAKTQFFPDELGQRLWQKTTQGYMPNWSIGFIPLKKEIIPNKDPDGWSGRDITEWELLEYSPVGVPMNPDAQTPPEKGADMSWFKFAQDGENLPSEYKALDSFEADGRSLSRGDEDDEEEDIKAEPAKIIGHKDLTGKEQEENLTDEEKEFNEIEKGELVSYVEDVLNDPDMKPYPNEHACRLQDPGKYERFRRQNNKFGAGIHAIFGVKDNKAELQAIRFSKDKFTAAEARKWCKDHDHTCKPFEAAAEKQVCDMAIEEKLDVLIDLNTKLLEVLSAIPVAEDSDMSGQQHDNPPEDQKFVVVIPDEVKDQRTLSVSEQTLKVQEQEPKKEPVVFRCDPDVLEATVKRTLAQVIRQQVNHLRGKID